MIRLPAITTLLLAIAGGLCGAPTVRAEGEQSFRVWWKQQGKLFRESRRKPEVQLAIIRSLGKRTEALQAGKILLALVQSRVPTHRLTALQTLADARYAKLAPALAGTYRRVYKPSLRFDVEFVETLGLMGVADPLVIEALRKMLQRQELILLRHTLGALRRLNKPACVAPTVALLLGTFPPRDVRLAGSTAASGFPWQRYRELRQPLLDTLATLTGKQFDHVEEWRSWYNDYKKSQKKK